MVGNMLVRKFSFAPTEAKIQLFKSYCYPIMDVLFGVTDSRTLLENLVSFSDTFKRLINVSRYTSSSLAYAMNATDHINVVFRKFGYSLMNRVTASPTVLLLPLSIAMHIISLH